MSPIVTTAYGLHSGLVRHFTSFTHKRIPNLLITSVSMWSNVASLTTMFQHRPFSHVFISFDTEVTISALKYFFVSSWNFFFSMPVHINFALVET